MTTNSRKKKVGFAILTWNSIGCIGRCIDSILACDRFDSIISILDNGSTDGTKEVLEELASNHININATYSDSNLGMSKGRNAAAGNLSECDYLCFLDSDAATTDYDGFADALEYLDTHPDVGILGPTLVSEDGSVQFSARNIPFRREKFLKVMPGKSAAAKAELMEHVDYDVSPEIFPVGYVLGACMVMRWDVFQAIGPFDEKIFYGPDDVDYCTRAWENGLKVVYFRNCHVLHEWQRISRKKLFSKHNMEHLKGLMHFYHKHKHLKELRARIQEEYEAACCTSADVPGETETK